MKKSKFSEQQIAFALQQAESGTQVAEVCRKMGILEATFYRWKQLYGGLICGENGTALDSGTVRQWTGP
jgi:putative transposase